MLITRANTHPKVWEAHVPSGALWLTQTVASKVDTRRSRHLPGKPSISPQEAAAQLFPAAKAAIEDRLFDEMQAQHGLYRDPY